MAWPAAAGTAWGQKRMIIEHRQTVAPDRTVHPFEVPPFSVEHQVRLSLEVRIDALTRYLESIQVPTATE